MYKINCNLLLWKKWGSEVPWTVVTYYILPNLSYQSSFKMNIVSLVELKVFLNRIKVLTLYGIIIFVPCSTHDNDKTKLRNLLKSLSESATCHVLRVISPWNFVLTKRISKKKIKISQKQYKWSQKGSVRVLSNQVVIFKRKMVSSLFFRINWQQNVVD